MMQDEDESEGRWGYTVGLQASEKLASEANFKHRSQHLLCLK